MVTFDPEGKDLWTYEYDLLNRLTKVEKDGKAVAEYLYDEAELRLQRQGQDATVLLRLRPKWPGAVRRGKWGIYGVYLCIG